MIELFFISAAVSLVSTIVCLIIDDFRRWRKRWLYILEGNRLNRQFQANIKATRKIIEYLSVELPKTFENLGIAIRMAFKAMDSSEIKEPLEASREQP